LAGVRQGESGLNAMVEEQLVIHQMHELLTYDGENRLMSVSRADTASFLIATCNGEKHIGIATLDWVVEKVLRRQPGRLGH
jgi:hypothetical protein